MKTNLGQILLWIVALAITTRITWDCIRHNMPILATAAISMSLLASSRIGGQQLLTAWNTARKTGVTQR